MTGFRTATRTNIVLGVGQQLTVPFMLEVGAITEEVLVRAETPLLDTTSLSSGANFDSRLVDSLPMFSNMPITLSRFSPGLNVNDAQTQVSQGYVGQHVAVGRLRLGLPLGGTQTATPPVGGNNYTIDGATNNGSSRRIAASPNSDMIQEMRVESSNFDASVGHGTGAADRDDDPRRHEHAARHRQLSVLDEQDQCADRAAEARPSTTARRASSTKGGRTTVADVWRSGASFPAVVDGRGKLFYFANYSLANDAIPGKIQATSTVPANEKHLQGDFSDLLRLPNPAQYPDLRSADGAARIRRTRTA